MQPNNEHDVKTDLKHDNMEFSAATDGDDKLDSDDFSREDDAISRQELIALQDDDEELDAALSAVETDLLTDTEILPEESDEDDYYSDEEKVEG